MNAEFFVLIAYLLFMVGIGVYFFLKSKDGGEKGYFLGGREMGPWVSALSAGASSSPSCPILRSSSGRSISSKLINYLTSSIDYQYS